MDSQYEHPHEDLFSSPEKPQPSGKPRVFRRVQNIIVDVDTETGQEIRQVAGGTESIVHPDGCTDHYTLTLTGVWDCCHPLSVPFGGRCFECGESICENCLVACSQCGKPICKKHAYEQEGVFFCKRHMSQLRRRRFWRRFWRFVLSPIIEFEEDTHEQTR